MHLLAQPIIPRLLGFQLLLDQVAALAPMGSHLPQLCLHTGDANLLEVQSLDLESWLVVQSPEVDNGPWLQCEKR